MKLHCAILNTRDSSRAETAVDVPATASVADLLKTIHAGTALASVNNNTLQSYLATPTQHPATRDRPWLQRAKLPLLNASLVQQHCILMDDPTQRLACDELFGRNFDSRSSDIDYNIHVVVVTSEENNDTDDDDDTGGTRPRKRARTTYSGPCYITQPTLILGLCCVPLDTIGVFRAIQVALMQHESKPMVLHFGPMPMSGRPRSPSVFNSGSVLLCETRIAATSPISRQFSSTTTSQCGKRSASTFTKIRRALTRRLSCAFRLRERCRGSWWWTAFISCSRSRRLRRSFSSRFANFVSFCTLVAFSAWETTHSSHCHAKAMVSSERMGWSSPSHCGKTNDTVSFSRAVATDSRTLSSVGSWCILVALQAFRPRSSRSQLESPSVHSTSMRGKGWFETTAFAQYVSQNEIMFQPLCGEWLELTQREWFDLTCALNKRKHTSDPCLCICDQSAAITTRRRRA